MYRVLELGRFHRFLLIVYGLELNDHFLLFILEVTDHLSPKSCIQILPFSWSILQKIVKITSHTNVTTCYVTVFNLVFHLSWHALQYESFTLLLATLCHSWQEKNASSSGLFDDLSLPIFLMITFQKFSMGFRSGSLNWAPHFFQSCRYDYNVRGNVIIR